MNQEQLIKQIIAEVLGNMNQPSTSTTQKAPVEKVTKANYPLAEKMPEKIKSGTGVQFKDMTLDKVISGQLTGKDMRISRETLELQAQVAQSDGRATLAANLRRAAELIAVPDDRVLEIYNALRPYRSTKADLYAIAEELETKYGCTINSKFVREAADVYEIRGRLKQA